MGLKEKLYDFRRKLFGSYELEDPRPIAAESPYTYYLPSQARLDAVKVGDLIKLIIRSLPPSRQYNAERMWVEVISREGELWTGSLQNTPFDMPQLQIGNVISFPPSHIIDIDWNNPDETRMIPKQKEKQYWDRCMVDQEILDGIARVGYLYREEPDMTQEDDNDPDSGWRIRADVRDLTDEQYDEPSPAYVALGAVLNKDDSWLHLISSEVGSRFLRNPETEDFEVTK